MLQVQNIWLSHSNHAILHWHWWIGYNTNFSLGSQLFFLGLASPLDVLTQWMAAAMNPDTDSWHWHWQWLLTQKKTHKSRLYETIKGTAKYRNPCYTSSIVTIQFRSPRVTISDAPPAVPVRWRWGATVERPRRSGKRQSSMETDRHNQQKYVDIHWYMCVYHGILSHILCGYFHNH